MQTPFPARDCAQAVAQFAKALDGRAPKRIQAHWNGADGVAMLIAAEAALEAAWPGPTAKELVWLTGARGAPVLRLEARGADGAVIEDAGFLVG